LIAYLIYHRNRVLKQEELIHMLWAESEQGVNPTGALKTLFYRVRSELERLWPGVGRALILCHGDGYFWNNQYSVQIDSERFDEMLKRKDKYYE
jgi:DNA-binding SARP family transcriptional activator